MGVVTIRNVDDDVIAALKARARANHRSLEGELRYLLARSAAPRPSLGVVRERAGWPLRYRPIRHASHRVRRPGRRTAGARRYQRIPPAPPSSTKAENGWGAMSDVGEIVGDMRVPGRGTCRLTLGLHCAPDLGRRDQSASKKPFVICFSIPTSGCGACWIPNDSAAGRATN